MAEKSKARELADWLSGVLCADPAKRDAAVAELRRLKARIAELEAWQKKVHDKLRELLPESDGHELDIITVIGANLRRLEKENGMLTSAIRSPELYVGIVTEQLEQERDDWAVLCKKKQERIADLEKLNTALVIQQPMVSDQICSLKARLAELEAYKADREASDRSKP